MDAALIKVLKEMVGELKAIRRELQHTKSDTISLKDLESFFEAKEDDGK